MSKPTTCSDRRRFLRAVGTGGLGAVAVVLTKGTAAAAEPERVPAKVLQSKGYQVTEHVTHYYKTARI